MEHNTSDPSQLLNVHPDLENTGEELDLNVSTDKAEEFEFIQKSDLNDTTHDEELHQICASVEYNTTGQRSTQVKLDETLTFQFIKPLPPKRVTEVSTNKPKKIKCTTCQVLIGKPYFAAHLLSSSHSKKVLQYYRAALARGEYRQA